MKGNALAPVLPRRRKRTRIRGGFAAKRFARSTGGNIFFALLLAVTGAFLALPLVYAAMSAFKPFDEIFIFPPRLFVVNPTWDNFSDLMALCANSWVPFSKYLFNSLFVTLAATAAHVILSSACAYPLAKNEFPGKDILFKIVVVALMFVPQVTFLPQYLIIAKLGMVDTYWAMVLPPIGAALGVFLMKQFMEQIPTAILEAARIDGCSEFRIFRTIVMPNVKPAWLTLGIFTFQSVWNNTASQSFVFREDLRTLPTMIQQIATGSTIARAGVGAAAALFLMLPPILLFIVLQSKVVETMSFAAIKE